MAAVKHLLEEILNDLSCEELEEFKKQLIGSFWDSSDVPLTFSQTTTSTDIVHVMVQSHGQRSVEVTKKILMDMNRTDLVERLSETSSGPKEKHSVDKHGRALFERVESMTSVIELLLETLAHLSEEALDEFNRLLPRVYRYRPDTGIMWRPLAITDLQSTVFFMVQTFGQQSVGRTRNILKEMQRIDLVQSLSDSSSLTKRKHSVAEHLSALINKVATMAAVKEILLETLNCLNHKDFKKFIWLLQFTYFQKSLPEFQWKRLDLENRTQIVDLMMETCGHQSVEVTREVLMDMNRTDLVQRLSETRSVLKATESSAETEEERDELHSALIQNQVETMASLIEVLLETLADLNQREIEDFNILLLCHVYRLHSFIPWRLSELTDLQEAVFVNVLYYGQRSVEKTKEILGTIRRKDLVQRLLDSSSGPKKELSLDKHHSALIQKVATMAAVKHLLKEILNDLSCEELKKFKRQLIGFFWFSSYVPLTFSQRTTSTDIVDVMVQSHGQQSVEVTKMILMDMNRTDLVERLSETSSGPKEKHSVDKHGRALFESVAEENAVKEILLKTLNYLSHMECEEFSRLLQFTCFQKNLPQIPLFQLVRAARTDKLVKLMVERHGQQSVDMTREVLKDMNRTDLVEMLSEPSSGSKGFSRSLEPEGCSGTVMTVPLQQDSSDWTKLEPEVNSTDTDEAPSYSLQSEAGNFECNVSGLRWVCKEKVSFTYKFCCWVEHVEMMERKQYMPAGPLIDIIVTAGKLDEVYLPHWICIDDGSILDKFAVLHIDDCGHVVEKVSKVTSSHVKLSEPIFSLRAVLIEYITHLLVKINCKVLIFKANTAFLTLHVFLIPSDPGLRQAVQKREISDGCKEIRKPHPVNSLKMRNRFVLTTDLEGARIYPENLKLQYESDDPNFFEIFIRNPDRDFKIELVQKDDRQPVWGCEIRQEEYQITGDIQEKEEMSHKTIKMALVESLEDLTERNLERFRHQLLDRREEPRVRRSAVEGKIPSELTDALVSTFTEEGALRVAVQILQQIDCNEEAKKLVEESAALPSKPGSSDNMHFVDKHRRELSRE